MPKSQIVDPEKVRKPGVIRIKEIPVNQYKPDISGEIKEYGKGRLARIYYHMLLIREFESMLDQIKKMGEYQGIAYTHRGPAHLSIGQEASAVGQCIPLGIEDLVFGSHRSHGEVLAKCLAAIDLSEDNFLLSVMKAYFDGVCLKIVEKDFKGGVKDLAEDFILYSALAEIFGRETGFNKGLGGSMHLFFTPFGSMPNNAVVGGSGDISVGGALYKRINKKPGIVICNIGDASMGCGPVWEGITLASMDQYRKLWPKERGGAPPILFNFFNNFYGMGGQTSGETMGFDILARIGAGVNPENLHAERVDGYNPLAVGDAIKRKKEILLSGRGPVLLDTVTYRLSGHSPSDASSYRTKEELNLWETFDCIKEYEQYMLQHKVLSEQTIGTMKEKVIEKISKALLLSSSLEISPRCKGRFIESVIFSHTKKQSMEKSRLPDVLKPVSENSRVKAIKKKMRYGLDEKGNPLPKLKVFSLRDGLFEAIIHAFYHDPTLVAYGEENRDWGGAFAVYRGLTESLPYYRLFNSSISEGAIVGSGVGYALCGGRALVELMYCDFLGRAGDEVFNQMSKWQAMSGGLLTMPLVLRISIGSKYGAQHSQDWTSLVAHVPGLKVMYPATPYDAKGMMNLALQGTDPVVFFESQKLYDIGEYFYTQGVPEEYYEIPEGEPAVRVKGTDLTIITLGPALYTAMEARAILEKEYSVSAEVIDLRFINPLHYGPVVDSIKKTGKAVLVSDACERGSFLHTVASNITQLAFDDLDAPIAIVGSRNWITPCAEMETLFFPQTGWLLDAVHSRIMKLKGHECKTNFTTGEIIRLNRMGV